MEPSASDHTPCALRPLLLLMVLSVFLTPWPHIALADIHGYRDKDGFLRFLPARVELNSGKQSAFAGKEGGRIGVEGLIYQTANRYKVEPYLLKAIIKVESDFDHMAVSQKGAMGLMQLMPETALDMDVRDPFDPRENIAGGTRYLTRLLERFKHDLRLALAAYNAGPEKVEAHGGIPPIRETQAYVRRVMNTYNLYKGTDLSR